jgi:hypothetical protein
MHSARSIALATFVFGCTPIELPPAPIDATTVDATGDAWARPPRTYDAGTTFYRPCGAPGGCEPGASCDSEFPTPRCTRRCTADADCPENGVCQTGSCYARCVSGGAWCDEDQLCTGTACVASCTARSDMPSLTCTMGQCASNYCTTATGGNGAVGAPCTAFGDCASLHCQTEASGWPGGMCVRLARMIALDAYLAPGRMPSGRCLDAEALGTNGTATEGDLALCLPRCLTESDCRDGYRCDRLGAALAPVHDDGYCVPWGCAATDPPCDAPRVCRAYAAAGNLACMRGP